MSAIILDRLLQIEQGRDAVIAALSHIGITVPEGTKIDSIAPYISGYGVFRGTMSAYEEAYAAGNIPVGTTVIIDDLDGTSSILGVGVLGQMILG